MLILISPNKELLIYILNVHITMTTFWEHILQTSEAKKLLQTVVQFIAIIRYGACIE
jgi:hypothetical protein